MVALCLLKFVYRSMLCSLAWSLISDGIATEGVLYKNIIRCSGLRFYYNLFEASVNICPSARHNNSEVLNFQHYSSQNRKPLFFWCLAYGQISCQADTPVVTSIRGRWPIKIFSWSPVAQPQICWLNTPNGKCSKRQSVNGSKCERMCRSFKWNTHVFGHH